MQKLYINGYLRLQVLMYSLTNAFFYNYYKYNLQNVFLQKMILKFFTDI